MEQNTKLRWGIIGAGHIAKDLADGVNESETGTLLAVASREQSKADAFGDTYGIPRRYGSYQKLLDDPDVDAIYIATPHPMHIEWAIKGAQAGKHLLVEKPIGMNRFETMAILEAARVNDVFLMEAFMYRCHPQTFKLREMLANGVIGQVQHIRASFAYDATRGGLVGRAFENDLGGGGILDVGCYPASAARMIAGAAFGKPFAEPIDVKGVGHVGPTGVDHYAIASLRFPGDILAEVSTGVGLHMHEDQTIKIYGSKGTIFVPDPWCPSRYDRNPVKILVKMHGEETERTVLVDAPKDLYSYEADMVGGHIDQRQAPAMPWDDTLGNVTVLDKWRAEVGVVYDMENR